MSLVELSCTEVRTIGTRIIMLMKVLTRTCKYANNMTGHALMV